jgi:DNA helicase HerA-like ATPase
VNRHHPPFRLGIFGASGYGKTEWCLKWLRQEKAACRFIFDPEGEFAHALKSYGAGTPAQMAEQMASGWCIFDPAPMFGGDWPAAFEFFCNFAFESSCVFPGRKLLVVDEVWMFIPTNTLSKSVSRTVFTGRRQGLDLVFIGQMPNRVHNAIRDSLTDVVCFALMDKSALEFPTEFGFDPDTLRRLPRFHWIRRDKSGKETRSVNASPAEKRKTHQKTIQVGNRRK